MSTNTQQEILRDVKEDGSIEVEVSPLVKSGVKSFWTDDDGVRHFGITSEEELRAISNIPDEFQCSFFRPNAWPAQDSDGPFLCHQARGVFIPPDPGLRATEQLLERLASKSTRVPRLHPPVRKSDRDGDRRMLEIAIADPHLGMVCYSPHSDLDYNLDIAEKTYLWSVKNLLQNGLIYGLPEEILFIMGNDYLHAEPTPSPKGVNYTTTSGVAQPEMIDWHHVYERGELLLIQAIDMLKEVAPVRVLEISGNHDRYTSFTMARVMNAYYRRDENVTVDCSPSPYKFVHYGCNLLGFHHGSGLAQIRLAALMANEVPDEWAATKDGYREWHLADQHRKGSAKPSAMEEQGVSVEFMPSIVVPNAWHREKSFNHQKRGAMGWVWNHDIGPEARLQINLSNRMVMKQMGGERDID